MVYTHQHHNPKVIVKTGVSSGKPARQTVKEKCNLCDAMHHTSMLTGESVRLNINEIDIPDYLPFEYKFTSLQIISAGGRAPPSSIRFL